MAGFNKEVFATHLRTNALPPYGIGKCATYVRRALNAAGVPAQSPASADAKDWGPVLESFGFMRVVDAAYTPVKGDIVVIQATSVAAAGHIQGYDGQHWVSDFVQTNGFWPGPSYRNEKPDYVIYRRND